MADVFGSIGNQPVELNNAATEATLRLLLQSSITANKQSIDNIKNLAQRSGLDPATVAQTDQNLRRVSASSAGFSTAVFTAGQALGAMAPTIKTINDLGTKLASGTGEASDVFNALGKLPLGLGLLAQGASVLASFQERQIKQYQSLTQSGVNFGGSLTQLRVSAASTYTTMDGFANLIKNNSEAFAKMGGTANDGAVAFVKVASELQKSPIGSQLRALGYTSEEVNQGLASYISMTGGRTATEMTNTKALTQAAGEYLSQLDGLSQITGKTRQQQEAALKEANQNAAIQAKMATMDESQKKAYLAGLAEMEGKFGKAGREMYQAQILGIAPQTAAAKNLQALAPEVAEASKQMADVANQGGDTAQILKLSAQATEGAINASERFGEGLTGAAAFASDGLSQGINSINMASTQAKQQGVKDASDAEAQRNKIKAEQDIRAKSEAAQAAETQLALKKLGEDIINKLMPIVAALLPPMNNLAQGLASITSALLNSEGALKILGATIGIVIAGFIALKTAAAVRAAKAQLRGASPQNPMHVTGPGLGGPGGAGGAGGAGAPSGPGGRAGGAGKLARLAKGVAGGAGGLLGGLALDYASEKLKESGNEKAAAGADIGSSALSMAGTGAMIGSVIPGLGTAVGGAIGGLAGGAYGLYKNWDTLFCGKKTEMPSAAQAAVPAKSEAPLTETAMEELKQSSVAQLDPLEKLATHLETLNKQASEMIKLLQSTAENTRNTVSATKALKRDLFPTPG